MHLGEQTDSDVFETMARYGSLIILALATGCGGSSALQVTGTVKNADGSPIPMESGMVLFKPAQGNSASGAVDQDGSFTLMTKRPGDGVQPGDYKVVLQFWKSNANNQLAVPKKYGSASTTPLTATVDAEHTTFHFKVEK